MNHVLSFFQNLALEECTRSCVVRVAATRKLEALRSLREPYNFNRFAHPFRLLAGVNNLLRILEDLTDSFCRAICLLLHVHLIHNPVPRAGRGL